MTQSHTAATADPAQKIVLHPGAGHADSGASLLASFRGGGWRELRLDIDPATEPDVVGSVLDMPAVADGSVDAIYSAHNIEHVYPHQVPVMLREFMRVLRPDGFVVVTCPDLQTVAQWVLEDKLTGVAYQSPAGPITPLDIIYGFRPALAAGNEFMSHKCGFTLTTLVAEFQANGFGAVAAKRRPSAFDLWLLASKTHLDDHAVRALAGQYLP